MDYLEIIKNVSISLFAIIGFLGLSIFYIKIFKDSEKIKILNKSIEDEIENLNDIEIEIISEEGMHVFSVENNFREEKKRKTQHKIEKLEREKKYILEQISIYKIFKK